MPSISIEISEVSAYFIQYPSSGHLDRIFDITSIYGCPALPSDEARIELVDFISTHIVSIESASPFGQCRRE